MLQVTVACALPSDDVVLTVCDDGDVVVFEKKCCCMLDDVFLVKGHDRDISWPRNSFYLHTALVA